MHQQSEYAAKVVHLVFHSHRFMQLPNISTFALMLKSDGRNEFKFRLTCSSKLSG